MCEALTNAMSQGAGKQAAPVKRKPSLLIADHDSEGRPVGRGGRRRDRDIMDIVDGANTGLQIPN